MVLWIAFIAAALVLAAIAAFLLVRRRPSSTPAPEPPPAPRRAPLPDAPPMTDLESALAKVTDRTGRPIGEKIEAEADHVDELRVVDDTGPLLRRALDSVERPGDDAPGGAAPGGAVPGAAADPRNDGTADGPA